MLFTPSETESPLKRSKSTLTHRLLITVGSDMALLVWTERTCAEPASLKSSPDEKPGVTATPKKSATPKAKYGIQCFRPTTDSFLKTIPCLLKIDTIQLRFSRSCFNSNTFSPGCQRKDCNLIARFPGREIFSPVSNISKIKAFYFIKKIYQGSDPNECRLMSPG